MLYILSKDGDPLMPSTRYRHIKNLLKQGKAIVISGKPFVIQLLYETEAQTQPLVMGIDPGRTNIGVAVVGENGASVFEAQLSTRNKDVPRLMKQRAEFRRNKHRGCGRRKKRIRKAKAAGTTSQPVIKRTLPGCSKPITCHYIKNKESRFLNRKRPEGWLTPTANQLLQTHLNLVRKVETFLPVTKVVLELNSFAFMKLDDPAIRKWEYQKGPLHGFNGVKDAVFCQQEGKCLFCDSEIEHYHHVVPRSKGGSETLTNRVGLCKHHHELVHQGSKWEEKLSKLKAGLNKKYGALSVLNQIIPRLIRELSAQGETLVTSGYSTKAFRDACRLAKTHNIDAYCIACSVLQNPKVSVSHDSFQLRQFRRQDRKACIRENTNRKYYLDKELVATNRHKAETQTFDSLEEYRAKGGRVDNLTVKEHKPVYQRQDRLMPGAKIKVNGKIKTLQGSSGLYKGQPNYYMFTDGTKTSPKYCETICQNKGVVFV